MKVLSSYRPAIRSLACLLASLVAVAPTVLQAADTSPIGEITVTTERREENLQKVPVAVSAFDAAALENRQITDYQDLQRVVPSLKMTNNITSPTNLSPSMRGSLQQDASLIVAESPFGIYVDDVYVSRLNGNNISLNDIERVEVLRGPQGTLYGRNTLQGAIKFVSRNPTLDSSWLDASFGGGNFSQYVANASAGGAIGGGFAGSIAAQYNSKDGEYFNSATNERVDHQRNVATRGKLRYLGMDHLDAVLSFSYVDSKNDSLQLVPRTTPGVPGNQQFDSNDLVAPAGYGFYQVATPTLTGPLPHPITPDPSGETKQLMTSLNVSYDFGMFTIRSITGFVNTKDFFSTNFGGKAIAITGASTVNNDAVSEELQIQGTAFNDRLNYIGGLYYFNESGDQNFGWFTPLFGLGALSESQTKAETTSIAVFGQADYRITDGLKATVGLRWVRDSKDFDIALQSFYSADPPVSKHDVFEVLTPKFGVDYTFQPIGMFDSLMTYASAAKGFKSGGYNGINIDDLSVAQKSYGPETNWTFEGGAKTEFLDRRVRLNLAYFYARINGLALNSTGALDALGLPTFPVQNVGAASIHGLEVELTAVPVEHLTVFANAAFEHGVYGKLDPTAAPAQAPNLYNAQPRVPQTPSYSFTLGFDYAVPVLLPFGAPSGKFHIGMDWFVSDDYVTAATNDFVASGYNRLNGTLGLDVGDHWNARLAVKNLTDREDITSGSRSLGGFIPLPPREVLFTVSYKM